MMDNVFILMGCVHFECDEPLMVYESMSDAKVALENVERWESNRPFGDQSEYDKTFPFSGRAQYDSYEIKTCSLKRDSKPKEYNHMNVGSLEPVIKKCESIEGDTLIVGGDMPSPRHIAQAIGRAFVK